jgi:branched-chain amino acid aminotransferase
LNNKLYEENTPVIHPASKAFRYGELVFETIRFANGQLFFWESHVERLEKAATLIGIKFPKYFSGNLLEKHILHLIEKNNLTAARVRVSLFKGNGGLFETDADAFNILIETYQLATPGFAWNENGLDCCFFTDIKKTTDPFSNYKTGNFLIYHMAALYARNNRFNESLIFNTAGQVCDGTLSNLFLVKNNEVFTPPLSDGCIDGILRKYLIGNIPGIITTSTTRENVLDADEIFLTNAIRGIQWVKRVEEKQYKTKIGKELFASLLVPLCKPL